MLRVGFDTDRLGTADGLAANDEGNRRQRIGLLSRTGFAAASRQTYTRLRRFRLTVISCHS